MVRLDGRYGLYTVISVDRKRRVADLVHNGAKCDFVENVAFSQIRGVAKGISEAIEEFLNSPILNRNAGTKAPSPKSSELFGSGEGSVVPR